MLRKQLSKERIWGTKNVHFYARRRELFGVIQDTQARTRNYQTRFGPNRKIQNCLIVVVGGALALDGSVPIGRFELAESNAHGGIPVLER